MTTSLARLAPVALLFVAGCGADTDDIDDVDGIDGVDGVRRVTLACSFAFADGVDLASGAVRRAGQNEAAGDVDLTCGISRLIVLRTTTVDVDCIADAVHAQPPPARHAALADVVAGAPSSCDLTSVNCNYLTDPYEPVCAGVGGVVVDRFGDVRYAVRVVSDDVVDNVGTFVVEYTRLP